jgi:hypothetical protein
MWTKSRCAPQLSELALPNPDQRLEAELGILLREGDLPVADPQRHQIAVVAPVGKAFPWGILGFSPEERQRVASI